MNAFAFLIQLCFPAKCSFLILHCFLSHFLCTLIVEGLKQKEILPPLLTEWQYLISVAVQETTPKSLSGGENWNIRRERTVVYSQDEGDLDLRPDPFSMQDRRTVNQDHASVSCSDNCQQSITNTATSVLSNDPSDDQGTLIPGI